MTQTPSGFWILYLQWQPSLRKYRLTQSKDNFTKFLVKIAKTVRLIVMWFKTKDFLNSSNVQANVLKLCVVLVASQCITSPLDLVAGCLPLWTLIPVTPRGFPPSHPIIYVLLPFPPWSPDDQMVNALISTSRKHFYWLSVSKALASDWPLTLSLLRKRPCSLILKNVGRNDFWAYKDSLSKKIVVGDKIPLKGCFSTQIIWSGILWDRWMTLESSGIQIQTSLWKSQKYY